MRAYPVLLTTFQVTLRGATPSAGSATSSIAGSIPGATVIGLDAVADSPPTTLTVAVSCVTLASTGISTAHWPRSTIAEIPLTLTPDCTGPFTVPRTRREPSGTVAPGGGLVMATSRQAPALVTETASVAPGGPIIQTSSVLLAVSWTARSTRRRWPGPSSITTVSR